MALTEKMKSFCREYFSNGGNGTQAYLAAYNSGNDQVAANESSILLKKPEVQEYLKTINAPLEKKAISEREKKRQKLWDIINAPDADYSDQCRAMDILNKMDSEYININRNLDDTKQDINSLDTDKLIKLIG